MKISVIFDSMEEALEYGFSFNPAGEAATPTPEKSEKPAKAAKPKAKAKVEDTPAEKTEGGADLDSLKDVFQKLVKSGKRDGALELLKKYKIKKIHEVAEEDMEAMQEDAQALLDAPEEEDDDDLGI